MEAAIRVRTFTWLFHALVDSQAGECRLPASLPPRPSPERQTSSAALELSDVNGNDLDADAVALVFAGLFFGSGRLLARWAETGWSLLVVELLRQVTPNGVDFEMSTAYDRLVTELFLLPALRGAASGRLCPARTWSGSKRWAGSPRRTRGRTSSSLLRATQTTQERRRSAARHGGPRLSCGDDGGGLGCGRPGFGAEQRGRMAAGGRCGGVALGHCTAASTLFRHRGVAVLRSGDDQSPWTAAESVSPAAAGTVTTIVSHSRRCSTTSRSFPTAGRSSTRLRSSGGTASGAHASTVRRRGR